jgi:hypothetical protein
MRLLTLLALLYLTACAKDLTGTEPISNLHNLTAPKITYLGVGGWLLYWKGEGLLLAPSFTNPAFPPLKVVADPIRVNQYMPPAPNTKILLIGHGHYDHLLDVPWVMQHQAPAAYAYGNTTVGRLLRNTPVSARFINVEQKMARVNCHSADCYQARPEQWTQVGHIRFMAIESQHAPHTAGINLLEGGPGPAAPTALPTYVRSWKQGTTLAFLIDLLADDGKTPVYRIHYQDSASNPPYGFPPLMPDGKRVDIAIMCAASTNQVEQYPQALLRYLQPRLLLMGHWEDFFGNDLRRTPQLLRLQKIDDLLAKLDKGFPNLPKVMPYPLSDVALPAPE